MRRVVRHNQNAWDRESASGDSPWALPVTDAIVTAALEGHWDVYLTPVKPVPKDWFDDLTGKSVLCLASGGGQQAPVLAAAGADVTSFDLSSEQLGKDRDVAERNELTITLEQGDMADLSRFADASFDLVFHPVSNVFVPNIAVVWRECHRVLREGGRLMSAFMNPDFYLFDHDALEQGGALEIRYPLPFASERDLPPALHDQRVDRQEAFEFSHSLEQQIGGQLRAGFTLAGFYEDRWNDAATRLNPYMPTTFATLALR